MDMRNIAISKLKEYMPKRVAVDNLKEEILELEYQKVSIQSPQGGSHSGTSGRNEKVPSLLLKQSELREALYFTERWVKRVERGLSVLDEEERKILDRFYIIHQKGAADKLADEMGLDIKTIYHRKDTALRKFTIAMCGSTDL